MSVATLAQTIFLGHTPSETRFAKRRSDGTPCEPVFAFILQNRVRYYRLDSLGTTWVETNYSVPAPGTQLVSLVWPEYADDSSIPNAYILVGTSGKEVFENAVNTPSLPPAPIVPVPLIYVAFTFGIPWRMDYHTFNIMWGVGEGAMVGRYTAFGAGTGTVVQSTVVHSDWVTGMQYSPTVTIHLMCTCSLDTTAKVFGNNSYWTYLYLHTMVPIYSPPKPHPPCNDLEQVQFSNYGLYTLIGCDDGDIQMFEPATNLFLGSFNTGSQVNSVTGRWIYGTIQVLAAAACDDGIYIVDMTTLTLLQHIQVLQAGVPVKCNCVDWNWNGTRLISAWHDFNVRVHDTP
jgi:hypothetical protein